MFDMIMVGYWFLFNILNWVWYTLTCVWQFVFIILLLLSLLSCWGGKHIILQLIDLTCNPLHFRLTSCILLWLVAFRTWCTLQQVGLQSDWLHFGYILGWLKFQLVAFWRVAVGVMNLPHFLEHFEYLYHSNFHPPFLCKQSLLLTHFQWFIPLYSIGIKQQSSKALHYFEYNWYYSIKIVSDIAQIILNMCYMHVNCT